MEQKRPADIFQELLDYLWNGLGLEEKGWKRLKKGNFKKRTKNGLTYLIWFERSRYNYIDYEIGHGNVEVGFSCIIKQGDDFLYSFKIEPITGGSFFQMLTEDLRLDTELLDTFLPLIKARYLDFIDRFEEDRQRRYSRSAPPLPSRRITVGVFMWRSRRWKDTEHQSSWRSTAVRRNCVERRKARCAGGWGCKSSISPMLAMWTMLGPPAAPWRNWTWSWETMSRPRSSMTLGRRRTKRAIKSTFRSRTWKSGLIGLGI